MNVTFELPRLQPGHVHRVDPDGLGGGLAGHPPRLAQGSQPAAEEAQLPVGGCQYVGPRPHLGRPVGVLGLARGRHWSAVAPTTLELNST